MFKKYLPTRGLAPLLMVVLVACGMKATLSTTEVPTDRPSAGIANPASVYCEEQGGSIEIREGEAGQYGLCIFPDGSGCDEWAFFRGECKQGAKVTPPEGVTARYINLNYGFTLDPSEEWTIENHIDHLNLSQEGYCLFIGFKPSGQDLPLFRTGMPAGDFEDGGAFQWQGEQALKKLLVYEGKSKLVDYCQQDQEGCLTAGSLDFVIWFEPCPENAQDYAAVDIPADVISEADEVVESLTLLAR